MGRLILRAVLPTVLTIALFALTIEGWVLPTLASSILQQKRLLMRELTESAWNIVANFHHEAQEGQWTEAEAKREAIRQIRNLHYGRQHKEYFWINDMTPRMIVHPYRADLEGQDLSQVRDPAVRDVFQHFVQIVREKGEGYYAYEWQYKDDPTRIAPKQSFVKGFEPWGWVVGTGLYLDDVQREVTAAKRTLRWATGGILGVATLLLLFLLRGAFLSESERRRAEAAMRASEERYRQLVESAGEAIIMATDGQPLYANHSMLARLGYDPATFGALSLETVLPPTPTELSTGRYGPRAIMAGAESAPRYEAHLVARDGTRQEVMVSLSPVALGDRPGVIIVASDLTEAHRQALLRERVERELGALCLTLVAPVGELVAADPPESGPDPVVPGSEPLCLVLDTLEAHDTGVLVQCADGLLRRLSLPDVVRALQAMPAGLERRLAAAPSPEAVARICQEMRTLLCLLVACDAAPEMVTHIQSKTADLALGRLLTLAEDRLGPPPRPYAYLILGSEARREQTLATDQDAGIVWADAPASDAPTSDATNSDAADATGATGAAERTAPESEADRIATRYYFLELGKQVTAWLELAGFERCAGGVMPCFPDWVGSLKEWKSRFTRWVQTSEAQDLLHTKISFDFRLGHGEGALVQALHDHLFAAIQAQPRFLFLMARNILLYEPPLTILGGFALEHQTDEGKAFDIKGVIAQIVDFARIRALREGIAEANTCARLEALHARGVLTEGNLREVRQAYRVLMGVRLANQARLIRAGRAPSNLIAPERLTEIERKALIEAMAQVKYFQAGLGHGYGTKGVPA